MDLLVANLTSNLVSFHAGLDSTSSTYFALPVPIIEYDPNDPSDSRGPISILVEDFNGGGPDIAVVNYGSSDVSILLHDALIGDPPITRATGNGPVELAYADVTGDNEKDLIVVNSLAHNVFPLQQSLRTFPIAPESGTEGNLSYSPDGRLVAWVMNRTEDKVYDPNNPMNERVYRPRVMIYDRLKNLGPYEFLGGVGKKLDFFITEFVFTKQALDPGAAVYPFALIGFQKGNPNDPENLDDLGVFVGLLSVD